MDATPATLLHPNQVYDTYLEAGNDELANLKIILTIRDPGSRELSLYNHMRGLYLESKIYGWYSIIAPDNLTALDFDSYVDQVLGPNPDNNIMLKSSYYAQFLKRWTEKFSRKQILVLSYDELHVSPKVTQDRICKFLGVDKTYFPGEIKNSNIRESSGKVHAMSCVTQKKIYKMYEEENDKLYQMLNDNRGPLMQQSPFLSFQKPDCTNVTVRKEAEQEAYH